MTMQPTRREFLTALGAAAVAPGAALAQRGPPPRPEPRDPAQGDDPARDPPQRLTLRERQIPRTGEPLPIVGFGSTRPVTEIVQLGEERVAQIVRALVENGGKVIDTWPRNVGNDTAFGRILNGRDLRTRLFVTINIDAMGPQAGAQQFERTLRAYQRESIDLVNVGSLIDLDARWPSLKQWQQQGRARYIGVTAAQASLYPQLEAFLEREAPDFVEINYSVTERAAEQRLLPLLQDRGIAVLASRPFMNGEYFDKLENTPLPDWAAEFDCASWAQFSLQYILANPAVTCVLTETTNPEHMAENVLAGAKPLPDDTARARMRQLIDEA